jgi:hypothetical protein
MIAEMIEDYDWESDESEDGESDESIGEYDDSAEDIGERARRRRQQRSYYRPGRGVQGLTVRGQDGRARNLAFPTRLATAAETNRGLANQEVARRALAGRLEKLEASYRALQKKDSSVSGLVTLAIGGSLTAFGAIKAAQSSSSESGIRRWAQQGVTKTAAVLSAAQLATSGAKLVIHGRYHRSGIGITADFFSALQLGFFAFGSLNTTVDPVGAPSYENANENKNNFSIGTVIVTQDDGKAYRVVQGVGGVRLLREIK